MNHKQMETLEEQKANWERYGNALDLVALDALANNIAAFEHHAAEHFGCIRAVVLLQKANWERYGNTQLELLDSHAIRREVDSDRYVGALLDNSGGRSRSARLPGRERY
jgi:hypothetical protein